MAGSRTRSVTSGGVRGALGVCALVVVCVGLSACGGSSPTSSNSSAPSAAAATRTTTVHGSVPLSTKTTSEGEADRKAAPRSAGRPLLACVHARELGTGSSKEASAARDRAVVRECANHFFAPKSPGPLGSATYRAALVSFSTCMRSHGVALHAPNTSGKGPIFPAKGIDVRSSAFRKASEACRAILTAAIKRPKTKLSIH
jgi:hypothetical protein